LQRATSSARSCSLSRIMNGLRLGMMRPPRE
jgi:hypothetical protein